jgi:hypothetical protein
LYAFLIIGCSKNNPVEPKTDLYTDPYKISDGCFVGAFVLKGKEFWCEICFHTTINKYVEWQSGDALFQKEMGCLTVGTFSDVSINLTFELDSFKFKDWPFPCLQEMILPGVYKIKKIIENDSVIFERGKGDSRIIYYMKKLKP